MPRRMLAPIISVKHYVQAGNSQINSGSGVVFPIANAVVNTALPVNTNDVKEGSILKAFFLEIWLKGEGASDADTQFTFAIYKNPGGSNTMTFADTSALMAYDNKKNILFVSRGVIGGVGGGQSVPIVRQWIKVPKGKQRMGLLDRFEFIIASVGSNLQMCGVSVYKEYQ